MNNFYFSIKIISYLFKINYKHNKLISELIIFIFIYFIKQNCIRNRKQNTEIK